MGKDEVSEGSLRTDSSKLGLVGRIYLQIGSLAQVKKTLIRLYLEAETDSEDKRGHTRDEAREKRVEWKCSHEAAVDELDDTGEEDVGQIGVDDLQFLRSARIVLLVEFINDSSQGCHGCSAILAVQC